MSLAVRGAWVVRTSITSPEAVDRLVSIASECRLNTLVVQVRGRGDAYYHAGLEPAAEPLSDAPADFDPLQKILKQTRGAPIHVHAWMNAHYVWSGDRPPVAPTHIVNLHPEWLMRRRTGEVSFAAGADVEGAYTCPSNLEARQHIVATYLDVARRYPVHGIHFDYIRYPSPEYCYCSTCKSRFSEYAPASGHADLGVLTAAAPELWDDFRREQINCLVRSVRAGIREMKPELVLSAAVFANRADAFQKRSQDWKRWLDEDLIDVVCPMAYTTDADVFRGQITDATAAAREQKVWAGIGAYRLEHQRCRENITIAEECGAAGILLFSFGSVTDDGKDDSYLKSVCHAWGGPQEETGA